MERDVALWIDHRQAVIAAVAGDTEELRHILSGVEKHVRFSSGEAVQRTRGIGASRAISTNTMTR
jgi:hypothetical protein